MCRRGRVLTALSVIHSSHPLPSGRLAQVSRANQTYGRRRHRTGRPVLCTTYGFCLRVCMIVCLVLCSFLFLKVSIFGVGTTPRGCISGFGARVRMYFLHGFPLFRLVPLRRSLGCDNLFILEIFSKGSSRFLLPDPWEGKSIHCAKNWIAEHPMFLLLVGNRTPSRIQIEKFMAEAIE